MADPVVGIIGVGAIGTAFLERLRAEGIETVVFDPVPEAQVRARALGAMVCDTPAAVGRSAEIIDVTVRTEAQVRASVLGPAGVVSTMMRGSLLLLHSTVHPRVTRDVAASTSEREIDVLDACVVGVPRVVREGRANFLVGGSEAQFERARPHLLRLGHQVFHMGPLGCGNIAKAIKNLAVGSERLVVLEALRIGQAAGVPWRAAIEMMSRVYEQNVVERWEDAFDAGSDEPRAFAGTNLYDKDLPLAVEIAHEFGVEVPISDRLAEAGQRLVDEEKAFRGEG